MLQQEVKSDVSLAQINGKSVSHTCYKVTGLCSFSDAECNLTDNEQFDLATLLSRTLLNLHFIVFFCVYKIKYLFKSGISCCV